MGGIYITPQITSTFGGNLSAAELAVIKPAGIIVWVYLDVYGNISLKGDVKFFKFNGNYFEKGFELIPNGVMDFDVKSIDTYQIGSLDVMDMKGTLSTSQNLGLAVAADVMVGGIRPFTVKSELMGVNAKAAIEGEGGYRIFPKPSGFQGSLCADFNFKVYSDLAVKAQIEEKLKTPVSWFNVKEKYAPTIKPLEKIWFNLPFAGCVNSFKLPLQVNVEGVNKIDSNKSDVQFDFAEAYSNHRLRDQTGNWRLIIKNLEGDLPYDTNGGDNGIYTMALAPGVYEATMQALSKSLENSSGKLVIAESAPINFEVIQREPSAPWLNVKLKEIKYENGGADIIFDVDSSSKMSEVKYERIDGDGQSSGFINLRGFGGCPGTCPGISVCGGFADIEKNQGYARFSIINDTKKNYIKNFIYKFCNDKTCTPPISVAVNVPAAESLSCEGGGEPVIGGGIGVHPTNPGRPDLGEE